LEIFDIYNTLIISIALIVTLPLAIIMYSQLVFSPPYSRNFTFKLIAFNGITVPYPCLNKTVDYALSLFFFFSEIVYNFMLKMNYTCSGSFDYLFRGSALHSALFVALNRLKTLIYIKRKGNDTRFVFVSILISFILSSLRIIDLCVFSNQYYVEIDFGSGPVFFPGTDILEETIRTIADVENAVASGVTLTVNLLLAILLTRRRNVAAESNTILQFRKIKAKRGLVITSVVSFIFYTLLY
ncbi:hypothetical protein PENTCL1PPCAC_24700, partial [Pristionchus entomophagus]